MSKFEILNHLHCHGGINPQITFKEKPQFKTINFLLEDQEHLYQCNQIKVVILMDPNLQHGGHLIT